jgi:hypothetical protein
MNGQEDKRDSEGIQNDGVSYYGADAQRLQSYVVAERQLSQFQAPVFIHVDNPHERLFVAAFDGTGNDEIKDPQHKTNVAKIRDQIYMEGDQRIFPGYVAGPGTQDSWLARTRDGMTGGTYESRMEDMYKQLIDRAKRWRDEDPQAEIRIATVGFSRGAEQAAGFARLVEERGIQDRSGAVYARNSDNMITGVTYTKEPLVPAGQVAQAEMLFDPVGTGVPEKHDRRSPPSVISGFQIIAEDERRSLFKSDHIIDPGQTPDGRFLGVTVAGAHSDIGGSYHRDGLSNRSENLGIDYLNALSDKPFLKNVPESADPRLNVVHRSEEGMLLYRLAPKVERDSPEGYNERLVPQETHRLTTRGPDGPTITIVHSEKVSVHDPFNAEPRNESLSAQFEHQPVKIGQSPVVEPLQAGSFAVAGGGKSLDGMFDGLCAAASAGDHAGMRAISGSYLESAQGQSWLAQGQQFNMEAQALVQAAHQAHMQSQQAIQQRGGPCL